MTLWSSPHPKESAALSLGQAQQGGEAGKIKELATSENTIPIMPCSVTSFSSDGSEDAGFEDGPMDADLGDEETEGIQIDCIQTLTEFDSTGDMLQTMTPEGPIIADADVAIPLPAPPMQLGIAYGGNQSYLNIQTKLHVMERPSSPMPPYWDTNESRHLSRAPGDVGLNNIGNTCFMNSGLQCLLHTSPLVEYFVTSDIFERTITSIVYQFHILMKHAWFGFSSSVALHDFKLVLGNKYAQFKDCRQHDCQEFLAVLLDMLHEELKLKQKATAVLADSSVDDSSSFIVDCTDSKFNEQPSSTIIHQSLSKKNEAEHAHVPTTSGPSLSFSKRLKLEEGKEIHSTSIDNDSDNDMSREIKRKMSMGKNGNRIIIESLARTSGDTEDEYVDIENIENEAEGNSKFDAMSVNDRSRHAGSIRKAQTFWDDYIQENNTVIASTFQGLFKSSVVCSECRFVSETYEPFMYLSLPIPRVMEKQLNATFISMNDRQPVKIELTVHLMDTAHNLAKQVVNSVDRSIWDETAHYAVAEIVNNRVARILDDKMQLRYLSSSPRNIYVYELNANFSAKYGNGPSDYSSTLNHCTSYYRKTSTKPINDEWETDANFRTSIVGSTSTFEPLRAPVGGGAYEIQSSSIRSNDEGVSTHENDKFNKVQCNICLEDYSRNELKQHLGCSCVLCEECLMKSIEHFQTDDETPQEGLYVKCAVCLNTVECKKAFVSIEESSLLSSPPEFITIPVIFRNEPGTDANNNASFIQGLFGSPWLIRVPSYLNATELIEFIECINPFPGANHRLISVKNDAKNCGQCVFSSRCNGCELPVEGMISLNSCNSIMISYTGLPLERVIELQPCDMATQSELGSFSFNRNEEPTIDIHDCLRTFSETEHLDEQNPWFCPRCKKNQSATKTLSICKFPDYLIVYLKRFVFLDQSSNKLNNRLTFPIHDLDVSEYVTEGFSTEGVGKYNLYSCVCHFGSASVGHYTAFAKNPVTNRWHYFNDDNVSERTPAEAEYASAYVLFYEKQGLKCNVPTKCNTPLPELNNFNALSSSYSDTRGSYLHTDSISTGPVRTDGEYVEPNLQVDSTSFSYPQPSTSTQEDILGLEVDEGVGEIREGLGLTENDSTVIVTSSTCAPEDQDLMFDGTAGRVESDSNESLGAIVASSQNSKPSNINIGGADSTSQE